MDADITIIGAGVVGLAIARQVGCAGRDVFLLEQHESFGKETSSRNSEVIHAGIYYPAGSLKAKLCVEGAEMLYALCAEHKIPHARIGKLIVAVDDNEVSSLAELKAKAEANGARGLALLTAQEVLQLEPHVRATAGLFSPSTGIIDSHGLMQFYESAAEANGVSIVYGCRVLAVDRVSDGYRLEIRDSQGPCKLQTRIVVNAAGLHAHHVAAMAGRNAERYSYRLHYCKGEYFSVNPSKGKLVGRLVYPSPLHELTGLGIHATKDLGGRLKLGPNAFYLGSLDYSVDPAHGVEFYDSVKGFLPFLEPDDLLPDTAGIRPKLQGPGQPFADFVIQHETALGLPGWINLIGIESPGLTASPAIAQVVADMVNSILA